MLVHGCQVPTWLLLLVVLMLRRQHYSGRVASLPAKAIADVGAAAADVTAVMQLQLLL
jgi:hypothetical protein